MSSKIKSAIEILAIVFLFLIVSYFARQNIDFLQGLIGGGFYGIFAYVLITIIAVVVAPFSMMPLIPLASNIYGVFWSAIINIIGWIIGAFIVFFICRKYGVNLIRKFISLEKINRMESKIPKENIFLSIILLRMTIPVDVLSYALGLFSKVDFKTYALATIIGITPFAFVFSYLGIVPFYYQAIGVLVIILLVWVVNKFYKKGN